MYIAMRKTCPPKDEIALAGLELRGESCGGTPRTLGCKEKERPLLRQKLTIDIYTSSLISWILAKAGGAFMLHAQLVLCSHVPKKLPTQLHEISPTAKAELQGCTPVSVALCRLSGRPGAGAAVVPSLEPPTTATPMEVDPATQGAIMVIAFAPVLTTTSTSSPSSGGTKAPLERLPADDASKRHRAPQLSWLGHQCQFARLSQSDKVPVVQRRCSALLVLLLSQRTSRARHHHVPSANLISAWGTTSTSTFPTKKLTSTSTSSSG